MWVREAYVVLFTAIENGIDESAFFKLREQFSNLRDRVTANEDEMRACHCYVTAAFDRYHRDGGLIVLNAVERLPEFSGGIVQAADDGEPYETLVRQLNALHENIDELAQLAVKAKVTSIAEIVYSE